MEQSLTGITLYRLAETYNYLLTVADDPDTSQDEVNAALANVDGAIADKVERGVRYMTALDDACEGIAASIKQLTEQKKRLARRRKRIESAYLNALHVAGRDSQLIPSLGEVRIRRNPPSVIIDDAAKVPERFQRQKITIEMDKAKIKTAFKDGEKVDGCHLQTTERLVW